MSASQHLRLRELRAVLQLVNEAGDLGSSATAWRSHVLRGLIDLVGGQVGMTVDLADAMLGSLPRPLEPLDMGWTGSAEQRKYYEYCQGEIVDDPGTEAIFEGHQKTHFLTVTREQVIDDRRWYSSPAVSETRRAAGVDDFVCSTISWGPGWLQGFIVYRPWKAPRFGLRQRRMMRLCHLSLLRLFKSCRSQSEQDNEALNLPPRVGQTLDLLLAGATMKQISEKLAISVHTVNDYTKILHRRLEVNSRSELLNKCRSRRPSRILTLPSGMQDPVWPA